MVSSRRLALNPQRGTWKSHISSFLGTSFTGLHPGQKCAYPVVYHQVCNLALVGQGPRGPLKPHELPPLATAATSHTPTRGPGSAGWLDSGSRAGQGGEPQVWERGQCSFPRSQHRFDTPPKAGVIFSFCSLDIFLTLWFALAINFNLI